MLLLQAPFAPVNALRNGATCSLDYSLGCLCKGSCFASGLPFFLLMRQVQIAQGFLRGGIDSKRFAEVVLDRAVLRLHFVGSGFEVSSPDTEQVLRLSRLHEGQ